MTRIANISLAAARPGLVELEVGLGQQRFFVSRYSVGRDYGRVRQLLRELDGDADVIAISGLIPSVTVANETYSHPEVDALLALPTSTPVVTGQELRSLYQRWCLRHLARTDKLADQRARRRDEWPEAMSTSLREREVAAARAYFDPYQIIFCVRPDVVLVPPTPLAYERSLGAFDLLRSAAAFPGFQLIGGSVWRKFWYHNRDLDLAHMLSAPARVGDWLGLETKAADRCGAYPGCARQPPVPPPRPSRLSRSAAPPAPPNTPSPRAGPSSSRPRASS
jgi:hypothetical protein